MHDLKYLIRTDDLLDTFNNFCFDKGYLEAQITIRIARKVVVQVYWMEEGEDICTGIDDSLERSFEKLYGRFYAWLMDDDEFVDWMKKNDIII